MTKGKGDEGRSLEGNRASELTREIQALKDAAELTSTKKESKNVPEMDEANAFHELSNDPSIPMLDEANAVHELNNDHKALGMNSSSTRAELESGWRGWEASNKV